MFFKNLAFKRKSKKILEVIESKEKLNNSAGSLWSWQKGYPESQWELLSRLRNGRFIENEKEIIFYTSKNEELGLTKDFLIGKTKEKEIYGSPGSLKIEKNLINKGIFEITDRVGHYIKIKVEPMFKSSEVALYDFKYVELNGQRLALLYIALSNNLFDRPKKGQIYYEKNNNGSCSLFFKCDYYVSLQNSMLKAQYQGKFAQSNSESDWIDLKNVIDTATISEREDVENLKPYDI
jgi:hypothetical protein